MQDFSNKKHVENVENCRFTDTGSPIFSQNGAKSQVPQPNFNENQGNFNEIPKHQAENPRNTLFEGKSNPNYTLSEPSTLENLANNSQNEYDLPKNQENSSQNTAEIMINQENYTQSMVEAPINHEVNGESEQNAPKNQKTDMNNRQNPYSTDNFGDNTDIFNGESMAQFIKDFPSVNIESLRKSENFQALLALIASNPSLSTVYSCYNSIIASAEESSRQSMAQALANAKSSVGSLASREANEDVYFTKEQVLRMSQEQIKKNFSKIRQSQEKW